MDTLVVFSGSPLQPLPPDTKMHPIWDTFSCLAHSFPSEHHQRAQLGVLVVFGGPLLQSPEYYQRAQMGTLVALHRIPPAKHNVEHIKHAHLGVFYMFCLPTPARHEKTRPTGALFVFG